MQKPPTMVVFSEAMVPTVLELWSAALPYSPVSEEKLRGLLHCPYFDSAGVTVAMVDRQAVGFIAAIYKKSSDDQPVTETGYITVVAVRHDYEGQGLGLELLARAEQVLGSHGLKRIVATAFPEYYFFPGIDVRYGFLTDLFSRAGFEVHAEPVDMEVKWERYEPPSWLEEAESAVAHQGFVIVYVKREHRAAFLSFMRDHFPGTWYDRAKAHIESGKELERAILALDRSGEVVGFVRFGVEGERGYIDSIGVKEDLRKRQIGSVLLARALRGMADRGAKCGYFGYTGAVRFYERVGAGIVRRYVQFEKTL